MVRIVTVPNFNCSELFPVRILPDPNYSLLQTVFSELSLIGITTVPKFPWSELYPFRNNPFRIFPVPNNDPDPFGLPASKSIILSYFSKCWVLKSKELFQASVRGESNSCEGRQLLTGKPGCWLVLLRLSDRYVNLVWAVAFVCKCCYM